MFFQHLDRRRARFLPTSPAPIRIPASPLGSFTILAACLFLLPVSFPVIPPVSAAGEEVPLDLGTTSPLPSDFVLGLDASRAITKHFGLVEEDSLVRRINDIGYAAAYAAGRPDILYTFQILDMDEPNAMALPGGWIFLTRGILDTDLTDAELANLLGHEITHVSRAHFARQGRLNSLLSLLQTAAIVMLAIAGSDSPSHGPVIEDPGSYRYPQSSTDAALTGTAVFGSVFHELLLRGYGRKLEVEADDGGRRLASLAGYPREAGRSLLQKLHDRIYEDREYGYWRTHPYFTDRLSAAEAADTGADYAPMDALVRAYRTDIQRGLAAAAAAFRNEDLAGYLYELALRVGPGGGSNLAVHHELLGFRLHRLDRRSPILRPYGPLRVEYDSLLAQGDRGGGDPAILRSITATRDSVEARRVALLPQYLRLLGDANTSTQILENFLENFPDHPRACETRLRLGRSYRLSGRFDLAAETLGILIARVPKEEGSGDSTEVARARTELLRTLPQIENPEACQRVYDRVPDPMLRGAARERLQVIADSLADLEGVGRFVQTYPSSPLSDRFRTRLAELAVAEYKKGRLHEALGDQQSALGIYNRISILAPGTEFASEARRGIARIQSLASSPDR